MAPTNKKYYRAKAFIFDVDTLIGTISFVKRLWHQFAADHGLDENKILYDTTTLEDVCALPGISTLLQKLPFGKWVVCTQDTELARDRLLQCGITATIHSHESMSHTIHRLGCKPEEVIVFEDAPAGVQAAHHIGAKVIACSTKYPMAILQEAGADSTVKLLSDIDFTNLSDGTFEVQVSLA